MDILTTQSNNSSLFENYSWNVAFYGEDVDNRGRESVRISTNSAEKHHKLTYCAENQSWSIDSQETESRHILQLVHGQNSVLLDGTTLGVAEICKILQLLIAKKVPRVSFLYIEPGDYTTSSEENSLQPSYCLSDNTIVSGLRGYVLDTSNKFEGAAVIFLGFEGDRPLVALEQQNLDDVMKYYVIGIPAFKAGWEKRSIIHNLSLISDSYNKGHTEVRYCEANSVFSAYQLLEELDRELKNLDQELIIGPFGTKPESIAAALYLCRNPRRTGLIYDHPTRKHERSYDVGRFHLYDIRNIASD